MPVNSMVEELKAKAAAEKARQDAEREAAKAPMQATEEQLREQQRRYQEQQAAYQDRTAPTADYSQAESDYALSLDSRGQQSQLGGSYWDAINGTGPSVAREQLRMGRDQALSNANAMAASARGTMNQAAARRQAMNVGAEAMQQFNQQAGLLRAQEVSDARAGLSGLLGTQRGQDLGQRGQSQQQAQAQQQAELQQRAQNDAMTQGYLGAETGSTQGLYSGQQNVYGTDQQTQQAQADRDQRERHQRQDRTDKYLAAGVGAGATLLASDRRVKADVDDMAPEELDDFLESLEAHRYKYKEDSGFDDGQEHVGVMAQDLEDTALGDDVVHGDDPKMIDAPPNVIYALLSRISDRLDQLEGGKRG